jgi:hypothetical protein
LSEWDVNHD